MELETQSMHAELEPTVGPPKHTCLVYSYTGASQVELAVKNPPANTGDVRDTGLNVCYTRLLDAVCITYSIYTSAYSNIQYI